MSIADLRQRVGTATAVALGVMLLALTGITVLDVTGRYLLNAPLPGGAELTELLVMAVIFTGLPAISLDDAMSPPTCCRSSWAPRAGRCSSSRHGPARWWPWC